MTKRFIATLIASLAFAGSVHATEPTESVEFMNDHALQSVEGAKLAKGFSASELNSMTKSISKKHGLISKFANDLTNYARYLRDKDARFYSESQMREKLQDRARIYKRAQPYYLRSLSDKLKEDAQRRGR